jgi:polygalacturonase
MRKYYHFIISFLSLLLFQTFICTGVDQNVSGWKQLHSIIKNINPPSFPEKEFNITSYGAAGDGKTDCTNAFKSAIEDCAKNGGGKVIVPKGIFLTGAVHLKSNVNLHLLEGALIKFSADPEKYLPAVFTRWEGVECMNYSPLIYAYEQENIAVTGKGILDGQGSSENWWSWKGKSDSGWKKGMPSASKPSKTSKRTVIEVESEQPHLLHYHCSFQSPQPAADDANSMQYTSAFLHFPSASIDTLPLHSLSCAQRCELRHKY